MGYVGRMPLESTSTVSLDHDVLAQRVGEETLLLNLARDRYTRLNASGTALWERLRSGEATLADLAGELERRWGVDEQSARRDAAAFVESLSERGMVAIAPAPAAP